jgi:tetratricopeptide (TPR) repeat protein
MNAKTVLSLVLLSLLAASLFSQANTPPISDEARKHFVAGTDLAKGAKTAADLSRVVSEFKQAVELAPQLPQARYNLARAREAAGDYSGAIADLKRYQQFKLSDSESRMVQDKIYALEGKTKKQAGEQQVVAEQNSAGAKQAATIQRLEGGVWRLEQDKTTVLADGSPWRSGDGIGQSYIVVKGDEIKAYSVMLPSLTNRLDKAAFTRPVDYDNSTADRNDLWKTTLRSRQFEIDKHDDRDTVCKVTISDDGLTVTEIITWHYPKYSEMFKTTDI